MNVGTEPEPPVERVPRLSVGVPVFNGERFLRLALDSVLAQTYTDFEVVICDNASDDGTQEICREYAARDGRIRYLRSETNLGAAANYNRTFKESRGELFKWMPHDDAIDPVNLQRCVEALDADPTVVLAYPRTSIIDEEGQEIRRVDEGLHMPFEKPHTRLGWLVTHMLMCNAVVGVVRRETLAQTRLIDGFSGSDCILLVELAMLGKFSEVPEYLFLRREHTNSSLQSNTEQVDLDQWFDTSVSRGSRFPWLRLLREQWRSVGRMPLAAGERLACYLQIGRWVLKRWRVFGGAQKARLKAWLGGGWKHWGVEGA
ncbi:MAG: glycosyltransferase involved in cell wall biosynthesis [Chlamydiales bacterium]|jgi:glycosyltransferase involved in cell wall biosynthesis